MNGASLHLRIGMMGVEMIKRSLERLGDALGMIIFLFALLIATNNLFRSHGQKLNRKAFDEKSARQLKTANLSASA